MRTRYAQWAEVVVGDQGRATYGAGQTTGSYHGAGRRVEAGVIRHVAEVAFVADAEAATQAAFAVAGNIVGKPNARRECTPAWFPELSDRTLISNVDPTSPHLLVLTRTDAVVEVGIQAWVVVVLHAVVLHAQAIVQRQPRCISPTVLRIQSPIFVAVASSVTG